MLPIQPTSLWRYFSSRKQVVPPTLAHLFYTSWEDALWNLLVYFDVKPNATALVPDFFCGDVISNMADHGLHSVFYPVDRSFQTEPQVFKDYLEKYQPEVVVILHAVGITNTLWSSKNIWLPALPPQCLLIEDSVHRVVDPLKIELIAERHVVIDSLRKVAPVPGANLYLNKDFSDLTKYQKINTQYSMSLLWWWAVFQLCLLISQLVPHTAWSTLWNRWAEWAMLTGYDLIGDHPTGTKGWSWAQWLAPHLAIEQIAEAKVKQVAQYQTALEAVIEKNTSLFFKIPFTKNDAGLLRGFPVGLKIETANQTLAKLRQAGLLVRFELNDSPWSKKYKVVYLPLGPHLSSSQINWVCQVMISAATTTA